MRDSRFLATSLIEEIIRVKRGACSSNASNGMYARALDSTEKKKQGDYDYSDLYNKFFHSI